MRIQSERDRKIIKYIEKFKVMHRDQIIEACDFYKLANPVSSCNLVLSRLVDRKLIKPIKGVTHSYLYTLKESKINEKSTTLFHSLEIVETFLELRRKPEIEIVDYEVEKFYGKNLAIPDLILKTVIKCKKSVLFFEVERDTSNRTKQDWRNRLNRYQLLFESAESFKQDLPKLSTIVLIVLTDKKIEVEQMPNVRVYFYKNIDEFYKALFN